MATLTLLSASILHHSLTKYHVCTSRRSPWLLTPLCKWECVHDISFYVGSWRIYIWKPLTVIKYWILLFIKIVLYMNKCYTDIQIIWIAFRFYKFSLSLVPIKPHYNVICIGKKYKEWPSLCSILLKLQRGIPGQTMWELSKDSQWM